MRNTRAYRISLSILIVFTITFATAEITLRLYNMLQPSFIFYDSSYDRFRGKPFSRDYDFKLNSMGFKDVEFSTGKADVFRIIAIGDSFAYGVVPYRHNYLTILEEQLKAQGRDIEVCNMGIAAAGPADYLSLLMREGLRLQPDMALLSFFVGNDFWQAKNHHAARSLSDYSYVASLIKYLFAMRPGYVGHRIHDKDVYDDDEESFPREKYLEIERKTLEIYKVDGARFRGYIDASVRYIKQMERVCRKNDIDFALVIIPDEIQLSKSLQKDVLTPMPDEASKDLDFSQPSRMLAEKLKDSGILCLDLRESFPYASEGERLYKPNDTHWNIAGNRLAALRIEEYLAPLLADRQAFNTPKE